MTVTQTTPQTSRGASDATATPAAAEEPGRQFNLNLPFVRIQVRPPELHLPHIGLPHVSRHDVGQAVDIARTFLPPPERLAYYGGLGALAVLGLIDWPVAAAIGAGTLIAQRTRAQEQRWSPLRAPRHETRATAASAPGAAATPSPAAAGEQAVGEAAARAAQQATAKAEPKTKPATATGRTRTTGK
ncbi:hypothetical protein ACFHYQ_19445 [Sphaerimonospora cavernae]|uniref:Uncharacterized protein n=1 Tax=Sphaerimonospora cavernae TaxID=1740611 RepID=A0ABV6U7N7_9ACTN